MSRVRTPVRRVVAGLGAAGAIAGILVAVPHTAAADPPPNPSDSQLSAAARLKQQVAAEVGTIGAQVAALQSQLDRLVAERELAEQKLALALSLLAQAKQKAITAKANVALAQHAVDAAQDEFNGYVQALYTSGDVQGTTGALLTASDPNVLLQRGMLEQYQATHQVTAIDTLSRATIAKSNADAAARLAVLNQQKATDTATDAKNAAVAAVNTVQSQQASMQARLAQERDRLQAAQLQLATLNNQRQTFLAYQAHQRELARQRAEAARRAAERARERAAQGGGGGGGGGPGPGAGGSWTANKGQIAANRALGWVGTPYAWAGGNASGPTYGVCAGDGAFNDCHVVGFDCSGLVLYAWAQIPMSHYAASQYSEAGSYHPSLDSLMPGDLVFWGYDSSIASIHHVAIYVGGGNVVQAPESGDVIRVTPLYDVSGGVMHTTRPLT